MLQQAFSVSLHFASFLFGSHYSRMTINIEKPHEYPTRIYCISMLMWSCIRWRKNNWSSHLKRNASSPQMLKREKGKQNLISLLIPRAETNVKIRNNFMYLRYCWGENSFQCGTTQIWGMSRVFTPSFVVSEGVLQISISLHSGLLFLLQFK